MVKPRRRIIVTGAPRPNLDARAFANLLIALDEHLNNHRSDTTASKEAPSEPDTQTPTSE
ncbi:hypothetical protein AB0B28_00525 [Glycomyces sp. NPDC046736]|uniref:hypothetical protein n=1 Tax=Glycomyces sp. NPDC046736 TaxID=3155615 RepID=UPI0033C519C5